MYRLSLTPSELQLLRGLLARRLVVLGAPAPPLPVGQGDDSAACQEIARLTDLLVMLGPSAAPDTPAELSVADVGLLLSLLSRQRSPSPLPLGPSVAPGTLHTLQRKIDRLTRPAPPPLAALRLLVMRLRDTFR